MFAGSGMVENFHFSLISRFDIFRDEDFFRDADRHQFSIHKQRYPVYNT